ncbi:MAG: hypothetical protein JST28_21650 [Acidobacteria bacterium]|nr:hypothetical protein [Acidobacteriota bacterium]
MSVLLLSVSLAAVSQSIPQGILQSVENAQTSVGPNQTTILTRADAHAPVTVTFSACLGFGLSRDNGQWWVLPINATNEPVDTRIEANHGLWVLAADASSKEHSWFIQAGDGKIVARKSGAGLTVVVEADRATLSAAEARPHSDVFQHRFSLQIAEGPALEDALAGFYWGTMLPSVVERTMASHFPYNSGYVLSTLNVKSYAGSYPAVDHEFQTKGRLAVASDLDLDVVKRMIGLQFKLMNDDPERLYRSPCSVQPDGRREYHIRRNSQDNHQNAAMFPYTGNVEVIEEAWHLYEATKDIAWLRANIENLEHAAGWTLSGVDQYGRLWSDVYYEDQVMKDGRETEAQAFAAYTFDLLSRMEKLLGRQVNAAHYATASKRLSDALVAPLPRGYWDEKNHRFVDWVDRDSKVHDHIHLLANALPVLFGYATAAQAEAVSRLIRDNDAEFERFPTFLSSHIADYNKAEIGDGGPYDLSAAGRYWYWDAAYRASEGDNALLLRQLTAVATEGKKSGYLMGERYDMDHVYYIDGKNAHGAEKYYEYPNVFSAVLIAKYLGITSAADADVSVAPHIQGTGSVQLEMPAYALSYTRDKDGFSLKNLSDKPRRFKVDLSALAAASTRYRLKSRRGIDMVEAHAIVSLGPSEEAHWAPVQ